MHIYYTNYIQAVNLLLQGTDPSRKKPGLVQELPGKKERDCIVCSNRTKPHIGRNRSCTVSL